MKTITQTYTVRGSLESVWNALTDPSTIEQWGAGPAVMDANVGTTFSLWGGDIHGKNIEVEPEKKLVQEWYGGKWDEPSIATFELRQKDDTVIITFTQTHVPENDYADIDDGWKRYYLGPLKEYVEKK